MTREQKKIDCLQTTCQECVCFFISANYSSTVTRVFYFLFSSPLPLPPIKFFFLNEAYKLAVATTNWVLFA